MSYILPSLDDSQDIAALPRLFSGDATKDKITFLYFLKEVREYSAKYDEDPVTVLGSHLRGRALIVFERLGAQAKRSYESTVCALMPTLHREVESVFEAVVRLVGVKQGCDESVHEFAARWNGVLADCNKNDTLLKVIWINALQPKLSERMKQLDSGWLRSVDLRSIIGATMGHSTKLNHPTHRFGVRVAPLAIPLPANSSNPQQMIQRHANESTAEREGSGSISSNSLSSASKRSCSASSIKTNRRRLYRDAPYKRPSKLNQLLPDPKYKMKLRRVSPIRRSDPYDYTDEDDDDEDEEEEPVTEEDDEQMEDDDQQQEDDVISVSSTPGAAVQWPPVGLDGSDNLIQVLGLKPDKKSDNDCNDDKSDIGGANSDNGGANSVNGEIGDSGDDGDIGGANSVNGEIGGANSVNGEIGGANSVNGEIGDSGDDGDIGGANSVNGEIGGANSVNGEIGGANSVNGEIGDSGDDGDKGASCCASCSSVVSIEPPPPKPMVIIDID